jgi:regulator of chromosome condensation
MVPPILAKIKFVQVACGTDHVLGLTTQGHVWVWGNGQSGQLGRKIIERRKVNGLAPERLALRRIKTIGTGNYHSFAVDAKGVVYAWGQNTFRQTGIEVDEEVDQSIIWEPTEVKTLHPKVLGMNRRVVQISGGEFHTLFRISDGSVYACGRCHDGELGFGTDHPSMVQKRKDEDRLNYDRAEEAAAKKRKLEEKKRRKSEQGAESESKPAISVDEATSRQKPLILDCIAKPALIDFPCGDKIAQVSAKDRHNLAVSQDGELFSWGSGSTCQLGLGKDEDGNEIETAATPTKVTSKQLEGWKVKAASAGGQHCVILAQRNA